MEDGGAGVEGELGGLQGVGRGEGDHGQRALAGVGAGDLVVRGVGEALGLGFGLAFEQGQELRDQDRVVAAVVGPAPAQDAVVHGADEGVFGVGKRGAPVGEGAR